MHLPEIHVHEESINKVKMLVESSIPSHEIKHLYFLVLG